MKIERPPKLSEVVAECVREAVYRGKLGQGTRLYETSLSKAYAVSRGTIREALLLLKEDGVVEVFPHRGTFITALSTKLIEESYALRILLETHAAQAALRANAYTPDILSEMYRLATEIDRLEQTRHHFEMLKADIRFHSLLCEAGGNMLLLYSLKKPQTYCRLALVSPVVLEDVISFSSLSHVPIAQALNAGDVQACLQALRFHLQQSKKAMISCVRAITSRD